MSSSVVRRRISIWWPVVFMCLVIATESTMWLGADRTSSPLRWLYQSLFGQVTDDRWEVIHHLIRKTGHFVGYGLVGLSWFRAWLKTYPGWSVPRGYFTALLATALVASADEYHQSFLPNRTSSPYDVLLDCCGAVVLMLIASLFVRRGRPRTMARAA
jgi:VanZ family protein